ncbi:MAG TPA: SAM-dependent methyltransferase [Microbacterium sp.]|nr:SAM-dependent methyltransferase [Microbacterium sp.]
MVAVRTRTEDTWEWLTLVDTDGPFLSKAALRSFYPHGLPKPDASFDDVNATFVEEHTRWLKASASASADVAREARDRWVAVVLRDLLQWEDALNLAPAASLRAHSPNSAITVAPWAILETDGAPRALVTIVDRTANLRSTGADGWSANAIDRMANLLRATGVTVGIVTDGRWWALVSAAKVVTAASGVFDAQLWREERPSRDAFFALASFTSIAGGLPEKRLDLLFAESVASAEQITEALGDQVRRAVELVLQSFSDVHLRALAEHGESPLPDDPKRVYEGAVTVLMRVVFLLFAEERGLLPEHELYRTAYAISDIRERLATEAQASSAEALDHTWETWHRLLAASSAVFNGTSFEDMRMPAYGGSLFEPARFPWLEATDGQGHLLVRVSDRAMLEVLTAVQIAIVAGDARHLSFRELDVEQIGYVYEGLLGYSAEYAPELVIGLEGRKAGFEPEIPLSELKAVAAAATTPADFAKRLIEHLKKTQQHAETKTANQIVKAYASADAEKEADARTKLRHTLLGDDETAEQLLPFAGLIRTDLRDFPYVVPAGGIVMTESPQRANTGTHYTPRSLAEEVVLHALQPLVYSPGPLDTEDETQWKLKSSTEILDLKVADIAVGSGAFLVAAARYLAARLVEARALEGLDVANEPELERWAIREVVARCLYGADINGMAVEMCKLSLWLISMDPGKPFSFVDDRVFHGNSLLGVTTEDQLRYQHIDPAKSKLKPQKLMHFDIEAELEQSARLRRELSSGQVDDADRMRSSRAKRALLKESKRITAKLRDVADGIIAAGLLEGGKPGAKLEAKYDELADALRDAHPDDGSAPDRRRLETIIAAGLIPTVDTGEPRWAPLHWILEAPDVIHDHGGFDAIIGNPPFRGGGRITGAQGVNARDFYVNVVAAGNRGNADLCAYFFLRAVSVSRESALSTIGLLATNTIAQGDTRGVGLDAIVPDRRRIYRAIRSRRWPAHGASLEFAAVWLTSATTMLRPVLDDSTVDGISTLLEDQSQHSVDPSELNANLGLSFIGPYILGKGFVLRESEASRMISADERNREVILPYLIGDDLNSDPECAAGRWVINFFDWDEDRAANYVLPYEHIKATVKPERQRRDKTGNFVIRKARAERWWQYAERASGMQRAVRDLDSVLAITLTSNAMAFQRISTKQVIDQTAPVVATEDNADLAILASSIHQLWAIKYATTFGRGLRYSIARSFRTFPLPATNARLRDIGERLDQERRAIMRRRSLGVTSLYNLVHAPDVQGDADIDLMRSIHMQIDKAVMEAYGWTDIPLDHGFHTYRQMERWTVSPAARVEILDRLLEENHRRAAAEAAAGLGSKKTKQGKSLAESAKPEGAMF